MAEQYDMKRYSRQIAMPEIGESGQRKLMNSCVAIAGLGGIGCGIAACLAGAGVGKIKLIDCKKIDISNLNRQFLFKRGDVKCSKLEIAGCRVAEMNPDIDIIEVEEKITEENAGDIFSECDIIADCLDNKPARIAIAKASVSQEMALIHGGCMGYAGSVMLTVPGKTACINCAIGDLPDENIPIPVLGSTTQFVASIMASETIRYLLGMENVLLGKMMEADLADMECRIVNVPKNELCDVCGIV